jgi:hypothetical protein
MSNNKRKPPSTHDTNTHAATRQRITHTKCDLNSLFDEIKQTINSVFHSPDEPQSSKLHLLATIRKEVKQIIDVIDDNRKHLISTKSLFLDVCFLHIQFIFFFIFFILC